MNGVVKRNTLKGLISTVIKVQKKTKPDSINSRQSIFSSIYLRYGLFIVTIIFFIGWITMRSNNHIPVFTSFILFPAYAFIQVSVILLTGKPSWLHFAFSVTKSDEYLDISLNKIYRECIAESYLTGSDNDIQRIDMYIEGLQELKRFSCGYNLKFTTRSDLFKITAFFLFYFILNSWENIHKLEYISHLKHALSVLFFWLASSLVILEIITYITYDLSEKKRIDTTCKLLLQLKFIIMDSVKK